MRSDQFPKPIRRGARNAWFVQIGQQQIQLGPEKRRGISPVSRDHGAATRGEDRDGARRRIDGVDGPVLGPGPGGARAVAGEPLDERRRVEGACRLAEPEPEGRPDRLGRHREGERAWLGIIAVTGIL